MKKYLDAICILIFFLLVGVFFYPVILQGKLPIPSDSLVGLYHPWRDLLSQDYPRGLPFKNYLITDPVRQQIPWRKIVIDQFKSGKLPVWNPFNFSGTPLSANIQAAAFYPFNFLFFILSFPVAWTVLVMLEPILGGLFLYLYLRQLKNTPLASLFGSVIWSFCGFNISWLTWGTITQTALWLPAILLAIEKIFTAKDRNATITWSILLIIFSSFAFFAGHAQVALYVYVLSLIYAVWKFLSKVHRKTFLTLVICVLSTIILTSIQWLPLLHFLNVSGRISEPDYLKAGWFLPWQNLVQFFAPDFFGNPSTLNYWGVWNYGEFVGYLGIVPLIFIFHSLFSLRSRQTIFWLIIAIASLILMLPSPISTLPFVLNLPLISTLQPTRLMVILDFSLVMLAVYGVSDWLESKNNNKSLRLLIAVIFILFAGFWTVVLGSKFVSHDSKLLSNLLVSKSNLILPTLIVLIFTMVTGTSLFFKKLNNKIFWSIFLMITIFDLFRFGWKFTPFTDQKYFFPETPTIKFLRSQPRPFRIMSVDKEILPPNTASFYGIESIEGYDPLFSERYEEFIAASERGKPNISPPFGFNRIITLQNLDSPLLPILNVKYVLSLSDLNKPYLLKVFQEGEIRVYEDTRRLPRSFFVSKVINMSDSQQIISEMFKKSFDPKRVAVAEGTPMLVNVGQTGSVLVTNYSGSNLELSVKPDSIQFLVISNSFSNCWKARVDENEVPIYRTDYIMMGLIVPPGSHQVQLKCEEPLL